MNTPKIFALIFVLLVGAFAVGRYSATQGAAQTTTQTATKERLDVDTKTKTVVKTTTAKDGTIVTVSETDTDTKSVDVKDETTKTVVKAGPKVNVSALVAYDITPKSVVYGVSVSKEMLGPVTAGVFALTNGTVGLSIGLNF